LWHCALAAAAVDAVCATIKPYVEVPKFDAAYAVILAGLVGTTIAPWQHFFLQAAVVEKRVGPRQYSATRNDVLVGVSVAW